MLKQKSLIIASIIGASCLPQAQAVDNSQDNRWYIAPFGTFIRTDEDRRAIDGWGGGLAVGKMLDKHFNVEIKGFYQGFGGKNSGGWDLSGGTADLQYYFMRDTFSPYVVVAAGGMNSCMGSRCAAGVIGEAGLGFTYELNDNLLLRSDVRYRYNNNLNNRVQAGNDQFDDMTVNLGFVIPFGDKPKTASYKPVAAAPAPVAVVSTPVQVTPAPPVDRCHGRNIKGSQVDANGCPVRLVLKGEHFKYDSSELVLNAKQILDDLAADLIKYPQKNTIEVSGHTSSEGSDAYNMKLSERRAHSVVSYLKMKGIPNKLLARGFGETQPNADNATEAGREENRRVELIWIE